MDHWTVASVVAVLGLLASIASAIAAARAASAARQAVNHSIEQRREALRREVQLLGERVKSINEDVRELVWELSRAYDTEFAFAGHRGEMPTKTFLKGQAEERRAKAQSITAEAQKSVEFGSVASGDEELATAIRALDSFLVRIERIRANLTMTLHSVEADNRLYRAEAIKVR